MDMTDIFIIITIIAAILNLFLSKQPKTVNRIFEVFLVWFLFIIVGIGCVQAFIGHVFMSNFVAATIGWPAGNPFQLEVGMANLAFGVLGLLSIKIRDNFLLATVIAASIFLLGAGYIHITNIMQTGNLAPGNAGFALIIDILIPIVLICLMVGYKLTEKRQTTE